MTVQLQILATVGDVMDRMSIVGVKIDKMGKEPVLEKQYEELKRAYREWQIQISAWHLEIRKAYEQLVDVNTELWDLENKFAELVNDAISDEEASETFVHLIAKVAMTIRDKNRVRAWIKRDIDLLIGHVPEVKQYGGGT